MFQIDLIKRLADQYSSHLRLAQTAQGKPTLAFGDASKLSRFMVFDFNSLAGLMALLHCYDDEITSSSETAQIKVFGN